MDQTTHAWIASRAVGLLEDEGRTPNLMELLKPYVKSSAIGAWLPDLQDTKRGSGGTENHVLKIAPYNKSDGSAASDAARFTTPKADLAKKLAGRDIAQFLKDDSTLDQEWWSKAYKGNPHPGQHLGNRAMAVGTTIIDLLIFGDPVVSNLVPGKISFADELCLNERTRLEQAGMFFFMLSHFIADSCMPCHCDARALAAFASGLHHEWELDWSTKVGKEFNKANLESSAASSDKILAAARKVDGNFGLKFDSQVPDLVETDIWKEIVNVCRGSFALDSIIAPPGAYPYDSKKLAPFDEGLAKNQALLEQTNRVILHDAVLNVAMIWKHIWGKFTKKPEN